MSLNGGELKCLIQPPTHPTYELKGIINFALQEDSGDRGDVTSLATVPAHLRTEAHFLAKENGVVAGIALADMVFMEVDPSLKVEWTQKDGDYVCKGSKLGKVYGGAQKIVVAERIVLNLCRE